MEHLAESTSFDGAHKLTYLDTGRSHIYTLDGTRVPGATTVGAAYPKGEGLIRWMVKQGIAEYDNKTKMKKAAAIGKVVHKYAECHMKGIEFDWSIVDTADDAAVIRSCISQYVEWTLRHPDDTLVASELLVASPTLRIATQIDLVYIRNGALGIRDYKTSKNIYISALHQTVLGARMCKEWLGAECREVEVVKFTKDPDAAPFESCVATNEGLTLNGTYMPYPGLLDELGAQVERNVGTYRHMNGAEKLLTNYYEAKKKAKK